jgi:hypothetical protein
MRPVPWAWLERFFAGEVGARPQPGGGSRGHPAVLGR